MLAQSLSRSFSSITILSSISSMSGVAMDWWLEVTGAGASTRFDGLMGLKSEQLRNEFHDSFIGLCEEGGAC